MTCPGCVLFFSLLRVYDLRSCNVSHRRGVFFEGAFVDYSVFCGYLYTVPELQYCVFSLVYLCNLIYIMTSVAVLEREFFNLGPLGCVANSHQP